MSSPVDPQPETEAGHWQNVLLPYGEDIAVADIHDALVIKEGNLFLMTDAEGNLPPGDDQGYGLYKGDTRYLSVYDLSLGDVRPVVLLSTAESGYASEHVLTNPPMRTAAGRAVSTRSVEVHRRRIISGSLTETIQVTNYDLLPVTLTLRFHFAADFQDIFEFRGEKRDRRGELVAPEIAKDRVLFAYLGLDQVRRSTELRFSVPPDELTEDAAVFHRQLAHLESFDLTVSIIPDDAPVGASLAATSERLSASYRDWIDSCTQVVTDNEFFNAMWERSLRDLRMLSIEEEQGTFVAAGTPWFSALFGRDSIISALQTLAFNPWLARDTLRLLAARQGTRVDEWRDEEPGKILHEVRDGEMASLNEIPMTPYYGSVDSTPLFLILAAEYVAWTGDLDLVRELEPQLLAALDWVDRRMSANASGYLDYASQSSKGLLNQGWKDSHDGIVNGDGTLVRPPIALVEVQGYVYAAQRGMAHLFDLLDKPELAEARRQKAAAFKRRFNDDFWLEQDRFFALALGAGNQPSTAITSNPGHCLWAGIVEGDKARSVAERLFANDMFSGWGIRTLSSRTPRYNPLGYHLGSVWPHDNSIISMGLKRYGFEEELDELATATYDCCRSFDYYRLPELFCGLPRTPHGAPVRYPVAAQPQAWAAGTIPLLLQAILGLAPNASRNELRLVNPRLPNWLNEVELHGLRVGKRSVDLRFERQDGPAKVSVLANEGIDVVFADRWPEL